MCIKTTKYFFISIILIILSNYVLLAQTDTTTQNIKKPKAEPMDLPNAIIYGEAYLNVGSSVKQNPTSIPKLEGKELDSLNSLEKQNSLLLPPVGLSKDIYSRYKNKGFLDFSFGSFITPEIIGAYEIKAGDYNLFFNGGYNYSSGHTDEANFSKLFLDIKSDYIAPNKYWLFGGSKTRTNLFFKSDSYNNYAGFENTVNNPDFIVENRTRTQLGFKLDVDGNYEGFDFSSGAGFNLAGIKGDSTDLSEQGVNGYLKITNPLNDYRMGLNLNLNLNNVNNISTNFIQANLFGGYNIDVFDIIFEGGIQLAKGTISDSRFGLLLGGRTNIRLNENVTLFGGVESGLENNNFTSLMILNPYLSNNAMFDYRYNIVKINSGIWLHFDKDFGIKSKVSYSITENLPVFVNDFQNTYNTLNNSFNISYENASILNINVDTYYNFTENDNLGIVVDLNFTKLDTVGQNIPYFSPLNLMISYKRNWNDSFSSNVNFNHLGSRTTNLTNNVTVESFNALNLFLEYKLQKNLLFNLKLNNILNSKIYIWNNYIERGLFASLGINWQF